MKERLKDNIHKTRTSIKKFVTTDYKMKLLVTYLALNIMYLLVGSYIYTTRKITPNFTYEQFAIGMRYLLCLNVIVFIAICVLKKYKVNLIHICAVFIALFGTIATILAVDINISLEGCFARYEGLYSIIYYLTLMVLSSFVSGKYKKFLINCVLFTGVIQACYAICQVYQLFNVKVIWHTYRGWNELAKKVVEYRRIWAIGFISNPNFFGTYMLLCLSYSLGMLLDSKKIWKNVLYTVCIALFMYGLLISNTSSVVVGLVVVLIFVLIYCLKNKLFLKLFVITVILLDVAFIAVFFKRTNLIRDIKITGNEATQIAQGNSEESYGSNRVYIWKNSMQIVPNYIWHGAGIDCFGKAFDGDALKLKMIYNKKRNRVDFIMVFDKAHNEYLQTLVTQGIFSLITYVVLYGFVVIYGIKTSFKGNWRVKSTNKDEKKTTDKGKELFLVLPIIGYLVQAFFNISVIEVAPIFFIALGLCAGGAEWNNSFWHRLFKKNESKKVKALPKGENE